MPLPLSALAAIVAGPADPDAVPDPVVAGLDRLRRQTQAHARIWQLGSESHWSVDQERGEIEFGFADGTIARAPVQIIGTYNTDDSTFLWGWDHDAVRPALQQHALLARQWGEARGLRRYSTPMFVASEDEAWQLVAVAAQVAGANGAYRGRNGNTWVYMSFGEVGVQRPEPQG